MKKVLWLLFAAYLLLAVGFGAATPLFEAPDEQHHFFTALTIATTRRLPVANIHTLARQEAAQPPLYYWLAACLIGLVDMPAVDSATQLWPNPYMEAGNLQSLININAFVHPATEAWPWQGMALAVHLVRLFSSLLGLGTLFCIHASGQRLWPRQPAKAMLATALVAYLPQFGFLHGIVSNDALIIFLCSLTLWQLVEIEASLPTALRLLLLGLTVGSAILTKMSGLALLAFTLLFLGYCAGRRRQWRAAPGQIGLVALTALVVAGWLLWRNYQLYGDPTAASVFITFAGGERPASLLAVWQDLDRVGLSAIAVFGWMNLTAPVWVYITWWNILALAGLGALLGGIQGIFDWFRQRQRPIFPAETWLLLVLCVWPLMVAAVWLQFMLRTPADQGRLLFPALLPVALMLAHFLYQWRYPLLFWLVAVAALSTAFFCAGWLIPKSYAQPAIVTADQLPVDAVQLQRRLTNGLELVASQVETPLVQPDGWVRVALFWRKSLASSANITSTLEVVGRNYVQIGSLPASYHGGGSYPSTLWPPDRLIVERIKVQVAPGASSPTLGRIWLRLTGEPDLIEAALVKIAPTSWPQPTQLVLATLGEGIALTHAELAKSQTTAGADVAIFVRWQVTLPPQRELTTFVHLGDPGQPPLAQADGPPLHGDYPTRLWGKGEVFDDDYLLSLPATLPVGHYPVQIGLYDPVTGERLPIYVDGVAQPHNAFIIDWLTIK